MINQILKKLKSVVGASAVTVLIEGAVGGECALSACNLN